MGTLGELRASVLVLVDVDLPEDLDADEAALVRARDRLERVVGDDSHDVDIVARAALTLYRVNAFLRTRTRPETSRAAGPDALRSLIHRLDGLELEDLLQVGAAEVLRSMGFERALFSLVSRSTWMPRQLFLHPRIEDSVPDLPQVVRDAEWALARAPFEAEVVRLGTPRLVDAADGAVTFAGAGEAWPTRSYVIAPVVARRSVVGLLHADRPGADVDSADVARASAHAHVLGLATERAWLRRRANQIATHAADTLREVTGEIADYAAGVERRADLTEVERRLSADVVPPVRRPSPPPGIAANLSSRELDILRELTHGFSNSEIAARLAISPGTVKTHVRNVLRKMNVHSRAAAVARLRIEDDNEGSGRQ